MTPPTTRRIRGRDARSRRRGTVDRRAEAAAGPGAAARREALVHRAARVVRRRLRKRVARSRRRGHLPGLRPDDRAAAGRRARAGRRHRERGSRGSAHDGSRPGRGRRRGVRARPRLRRDRRDHLVHEHVEPGGDDRSGPRREEGGRARADAAAVGEVVVGAGLEGGHRVLRALGPRPLPRRARLPDRRLRLHDVHRQLRAAPGRDLGGGRRATTWSRARFSRATGTSRRASIPR